MCVLKLRATLTRRSKNLKCTLPCWVVSDLHAAPSANFKITFALVFACLRSELLPSSFSISYTMMMKMVLFCLSPSVRVVHASEHTYDTIGLVVGQAAAANKLRCRCDAMSAQRGLLTRRPRGRRRRADRRRSSRHDASCRRSRAMVRAPPIRFRITSGSIFKRPSAGWDERSYLTFVRCRHLPQ